MSDMKWYQDDQTQFINPYQFVPLRDTPAKKSYFEYQGNHTGVIHCILEPCTPLAIPDIEKAEPPVKNGDGKHHKYPFMTGSFKGKETPFIPGSEIRGMIRAVYESATNSCLSSLDDSFLNARATTMIITNPPSDERGAGLIKKTDGHWYLYPAKCAVVNTFCPFTGGEPYPLQYSGKNGYYITINGESYYQCSKISFDGDSTYRPRGRDSGQIIARNLGGGDKTGYLLLGEWGIGGSRHNSHIIYSPSYNGIPLSDNEIKTFNQMLELYRSEKLNKALDELKNKRFCENCRIKDCDYKDQDSIKAHTGYTGYPKLEKNECYYPIFFKTIRYPDGKTEKILSLAMQGREVYTKTLKDIAGDYRPCVLSSKKRRKNEEILCPACALFGLADANGAYGSRVRFSDAPGENCDISDYILLKELASPKITATEFYTIRPEEAREWNYVYKMNKKDAIALREGELRLRGRKFYLHHQVCNKADYSSQEQTERNSSMKLAYSGTFKFDVFFDRLSDNELSMLCWCLAPKCKVGEKDVDGWHKLGHGRPLGLGSVKISIQSIEERRYTNGQYQVTNTSVDTMAEISVPAELKNILTAKLNNVQYPIGSDKTKKKDDINANASHQWFIGNKQIAPGANGTNNKIVQYALPQMPEISKTSEELQKDLALPAMVRKFADQAQGGSPTPSVSIASTDKALSPRMQVPAKIIWINKTHGHSAKCKISEQVFGFLTDLQDLRNTYKIGDQIQVIIANEFDAKNNTWPIKLAPKKT